MTDNERRKQEFGAWLSRQRGAIGYTQEQAAERSGLTRVQWARWETGASLPRRENCVAIAAAVRTEESEVLVRAGYLPDEEGTVRIEREMTPEDGEFLRKQFSRTEAQVRVVDPALLAEIAARLERIERRLAGRQDTDEAAGTGTAEKET